jgi:hypothetical protein
VLLDCVIFVMDPPLGTYHSVSSGFVKDGDHRAGHAHPAGRARIGDVIVVERVVERRGGNPSAAGAVSAISRVIGAAIAHSGCGRVYGKEEVYGSIP